MVGEQDALRNENTVMTWLFWLIVTAAVWTIVRVIVYNAMCPRTQHQHSHRTGVSHMIQNSHRNTLVDISGEIKGETERAYRFYNGQTTVWLPKSQCEYYDDERTMKMPHWLATEKGLI